MISGHASIFPHLAVLLTYRSWRLLAILQGLLPWDLIEAISNF